MKKTFILVLIALLSSCGGRQVSRFKTESYKNDTVFFLDSEINPRDTVSVPDQLTGEDSIVYIEDKVVKGPIMAADFLGLAHVHHLEQMFSNYNNFEMAHAYPDEADFYLATHFDSAAICFANRLLRMSELAYNNGDAIDKLEFAKAVNVAIDTFCIAVPTIARDTVILDVLRVLDKFSSGTQLDIVQKYYVESTFEYYRTIDSYRQLIDDVPVILKPLVLAEYEAWHDLNDARFKMWKDVSSQQEFYSLRPVVIHDYYMTLAKNRRAELEQERRVIINGLTYSQRGHTVTTRQWEQWISEHSIPEDMDILLEFERHNYNIT